jgi:kumamolisin
MLTTTRRERSWDYLYNYFDARGLNIPDERSSRYLAGGGGSGFSQLFETPDYQLGVSGVNRYTGVHQWNPYACPSIVAGIGKGGKMPDLSMNTDPYTGYKVWFSEPGAPGSAYATYGETSFISPQLCCISALINSHNHTKVGFWNTQIYRFAWQSDSPLYPLNTSENTNDNGLYTGTPGTVCNQSTGFGTQVPQLLLINLLRKERLTL